ncbi:MAG: tetratricopeptide repeat protein [Vicinamibacteraceae bacterium]
MIARLVGALLALAVGVSPLVEPDLRAAGAAPSRYTRLRTPNFTLIGEQGDRPLRRVAERMEQFREVFGRLFPSTRQAMPAPIVVHVFTSERAYQPFMPLFNGKRVDVGGYFQQAEGAYYITLNTEAGEYAYPIIFHEYVHLLVGNALADVPVWFNEGLAEYYSTYEIIGERQAKLGRVKEEHVFDLRQHFIPLAELLAVDQTSPLYNEGSRRGVFYAESWALTHYLLIGNPKRQGQLATYLGKYADGVPSAQAVREAFGVSEVELEKELRKYVEQSSYQSMRYTFEDKVAIDKAWTVDQPSDADGQAAYADLLLALRRPEEAAARAEAALKLAPDHARAQAVLGRIRAADGQSDAAMALLDRAVKAAADADYLPAYYQARLLLRGEGKHSPTISKDSARQALALLGRVQRQQPSLADAHGLSAYAWMIADNPTASMAAAASAFKLSPRHEYALMHARARVILRDATVRPALDGLVAHGSSDWIKREAQELIDFLAKLQAYDVAVSTMPAGAGATTSPTAADVPGTPEGLRPSRLLPVFRELRAGEVRELGQFEGVECPRTGVVFSVRLPGGVMRVSAKAFDQVEFFTYRGDPPGKVGCGALAKPERIYLTYRAAGGAAGTAGVAVAIELLPDDYQP